MSAVFANEFLEAVPRRQEVNKVAGNHTDCGMTDLVARSVLISADFFEEGMPAEARVLLEPVARRHVTDAVAEEAAEIAHLLPERR